MAIIGNIPYFKTNPYILQACSANRSHWCSSQKCPWAATPPTHAVPGAPEERAEAWRFASCAVVKSQRPHVWRVSWKCGMRKSSKNSHFQWGNQCFFRGFHGFPMFQKLWRPECKKCWSHSQVSTLTVIDKNHYWHLLTICTEKSAMGRPTFIWDCGCHPLQWVHGHSQ